VTIKKDEVSEIMREITINTEMAERDTIAAEKKEAELNIDNQIIAQKEAEAAEAYSVAKPALEAA